MCVSKSRLAKYAHDDEDEVTISGPIEVIRRERERERLQVHSSTSTRVETRNTIEQYVSRVHLSWLLLLSCSMRQLSLREREKHFIVTFRTHIKTADGLASSTYKCTIVYVISIKSRVNIYETKIFN